MKLIAKTMEYLFVLGKGMRFLILFILSLPIGVAYVFYAQDNVLSMTLKNYGTQNITLEFFLYNRTPIQFFVALIVLIAVYIFFSAIQIS
jgi:hypothetical protein